MARAPTGRPRGRPRKNSGGAASAPRSAAASGRPRSAAPRGLDGRAAETGSEMAGTTRGHNAKARAEIIRRACRDVTDLEEKIKTLGSEIRSIKQSRIKGDLGMKIADFNAALRLYRLEGDDRHRFFDTLRETFRALGVGDQLNFMDIMDKEEDQPAAEARQAQVDDEPELPSEMRSTVMSFGPTQDVDRDSDAYKLGVAAAVSEVEASENPYPVASIERESWRKGWTEKWSELRAHKNGADPQPAGATVEIFGADA